MKKIFRWLINAIGLALVLILAVFLFIKVKTNPYIYSDIKTVPSAQIAVILGAAVLKNGDPSPVLEDRANRAIELYQAGKVKKILVTGNNSTRTYDEVGPVREYLLESKIPDADILLDRAGVDTYRSLYQARDIFPMDSMIVVSQSFHLPRAVFIARALGVNAYGMSADRGHYLSWNYVREMLADVKAVSNVILKREPKYLGEKIPII